MRLLLFSVILIVFSSASFADIVSCKSNINGIVTPLEFDDDESVLNDNYSFREIILRGWDLNMNCPRFIALKHLSPDLTDTERSLVCLNYDREQQSFSGYSVGVRIAYLECREPMRTFCERVNYSKDAAIAISGTTLGAPGGATVVANAVGVSAVTHSSGAVILTGAGGYIAGTLATISAGALAVLTSPITITAVTVSVVTAGGSDYYCSDRGR